jgi:hypothetical protein
MVYLMVTKELVGLTEICGSVDSMETLLSLETVK